MAQVIEDGGFGRPILTQDTIARIASVLADPATAWRAEPADRRRAHARYRGHALPPGADENRINAELEQLMGADDMVPAIWTKLAREASDPVAKIDTPRGPASGFLVSADLLLTNWHVLPTLAAAQAPGVGAVFRWEEDENGHIRSSLRLPLEPDRFFAVGDESLDFALVAVGALPNGKPPGSRFGTIRMRGALGKALLGQPLNIIQHPAGNARKIAFRNNLLVSVDDATRLIYLTDTKRGSSGSPVFNDQWQLVALHHAAEQARDAAGKKIDLNGEPVTDDTPDHLRHWVANAGIRVSCLVTHLQSLDLEGDAKELLAAVLHPEQEIRP